MTTNPTPAPVTAADTEQAESIAHDLEYIPSGAWDSCDKVDLSDLSKKIARALAASRQAQREADAVIAMEYNFDTAHFRKSTKQTALKSLGIFISDAIRAQAGKETK